MILSWKKTYEICGGSFHIFNELVVNWRLEFNVLIDWNDLSKVS